MAKSWAGYSDKVVVFNQDQTEMLELAIAHARNEERERIKKEINHCAKVTAGEHWGEFMVGYETACYDILVALEETEA